MDIKISKTDNIFNVEGQINWSTANYFKTHFTITLNSSRELTIDINKVSEIDDSGMLALKSIYANALKWNKPFSIVGTSSNDLYKEFRSIDRA
ncbi:STAS domain-containing protein [Aureibaculum sp. A20]|uniref:STAS domain-containing protein n=1 Tax=Aureibaculum flavum TaxID=2795986 RepID=A0ABS0WTV0_9FLAO|nr:STAS domain-containing protein [Aureibaculum flavum]MBJ2175414.1 STAS domain-containing protein [Aureibaculum flavum]